MKDQTMIKRFGNCGICESTNRASVCATCVNRRLNGHKVLLQSLKSRRDSLCQRLSQLFVEEGKANVQKSWRVLQNEKLADLKEKLKRRQEQLLQGRAKVETISQDLAKYAIVESAALMLKRKRSDQLQKHYPELICSHVLVHMELTSEWLHKLSVIMKQICKLFPLCRVIVSRESKDGCCGQYDQICNARLPKGIDPLSVPTRELAASLGHMVQLLDLVVRNLAAPALHNSGFAGSCSRIWERSSYWDARPLSRSDEYPLFPRMETSWADKSSNNFGVASMESDGSYMDSFGSDSLGYPSIPRPAAPQTDLQRGIALLKKSVACITAYCYNSLQLEVPSESSTIEAFAKLLYTLSSPKEVRLILSRKMACSRSYKQVLLSNKSVWNMNSSLSTALLDSAQILATSSNTTYNKLPNSSASYLSATGFCDIAKDESLIDGWDIVDHPISRSPPWRRT